MNDWGTINKKENMWMVIELIVLWLNFNSLAAKCFELKPVSLEFIRINLSFNFL